MTGGTLLGDEEEIVRGVNCLQEAVESEATFLENPRYQGALEKTKASLICIHPDAERIAGKNYLLTKTPSLAFQKIAETLLRDRLQKTGFVGIHPTAIVHETAEIGEGATIGPYVVIDAHVRIGKGCTLLAHTAIGPNTIIGDHCTLYQHVTIREGCLLGDRVIVQPGAVIGSCGYGYHTNARGEHEKLTQLGNVVVANDVEIGANTTIDRGRFKSTSIGEGSKIDNLVQIGHNVQIGKHNLIVAQVGIAGSSKTGNWVVLAGQVGVAGHLEIGDHVIVASKGGVTKSIAQPGKYNGVPAEPIHEYNRHQVLLRRLVQKKTK